MEEIQTTLLELEDHLYTHFIWFGSVLLGLPNTILELDRELSIVSNRFDSLCASSNVYLYDLAEKYRDRIPMNQ